MKLQSTYKHKILILISACLFLQTIWTQSICLGQQCNIIYVSPSGASSGVAGTSTNPASLDHAFTLITPGNNQLWLASGYYQLSNTLNMVSNVTIEGGFDPSTWIKSNNLPSIIFRDNANMLTGPNRLVAFDCIGISNFRLQDLTIVVEDGIGDGTSVYGIHLDGCASYSITRVIVNAGNGTDGLPGVSGANGVNGTIGANGQQGDANGGCCTGGGAGGSGGFAGSNAGGNGGDGGSRGTGNCICQGTAPNGSAGQNGGGAGGGNGGSGGAGYCAPFCVSTGCDAGPANAGVTGTNGLDGANGSNGNIGVPGFGSYYVNGNGFAGTQGEHGSGGGGGGGGGSQGCLESCLWWDYNGAGAGGGGGGEGGQGGLGATGGTGGGSSFGIYIFNNGGNSKIMDCTVNAGLQGYGGLGGIPGGNGGLGGSGGLGISSDCDLGDPGEGGIGGNGGNGGDGGNGAPGVSFPIYEDPSGIAAAQSNMNSPVEPQIFVKNTGCTYSDIEFYTDASGIIIWYFDGGTTPLSITGDSAVVQYTTTGRHSITLVVDGVPYVFTDFVGIFTDGSIYTPDILASDSLVCPAQNITLISSNSTALYYEWVIHDVVPVSFSGNSTTAINHSFQDTGSYLVTLQTTSFCCGKSKIDSLEIIVLPVLEPGIYLSANSSTVCAGETASFGAVPINAGDDPTFQWQVNSLPSGLDTNYFSGVFNDGDIISCIITSDYECPLSPTTTSAPFLISVFPNPTVSCSATRLYLGANTEFTVTPISGAPPFTYSWDFGDGGIDTAANTTHYYGGTGTYTYTVTVTDSNGCETTCTDIIDIVVAPYVEAGYSSNIIQACDSALVQFTDTSNGNPDTWFWSFGDGATDTTQNPSHTYTTAGSYTVTLAVTNGVYTDTTVMPNYVVVTVSPQASINAMASFGCENLSTQLLDESLGATSWHWDFGDGDTSNLQNPGHSYNTVGSYVITLTVGNNNFCFDTTTITLDVYPSPIAAFSYDSACANQPIQFQDLSTIQGGSIAEWSWDFGDESGFVTDQHPTHSFVSGGMYVVSLEVSSDYGCKDTITDTLLIYPKPIAAFTVIPDTGTLINPVISFIDQTTSNSSLYWYWDFGDGSSANEMNPVHMYGDTGSYLVELMVTDTNGCQDSIAQTVEIIPDYILFIPNTFTPNGDGINDLFKPDGIGIRETGYHFFIYNRWGDLVFETNDINERWDGRANNSSKIAQPDVYVWLVITKDLQGKPHQYTGHITLIK